MSPESFLMPMVALIILFAALSGPGASGSMTFSARGSSGSPPVADAQRAVKINCEIRLVDADQRLLLVKLDDGEERRFKVDSAATVMKNGKDVELGALAEGDTAVLHLASAGSDVVTRVQAASPR